MVRTRRTNKKRRTIEDAFLRITKAELGEPYPIEQARLLGAFTHKYQANFAHVPGISTHYVALAYELNVDVNLEQLPMEQHSEYRWVSENGDLAKVHRTPGRISPAQSKKSCNPS